MWGASFAEMFYKNLNVKIHCETNVKLVFQEKFHSVSIP